MSCHNFSYINMENFMEIRFQNLGWENWKAGIMLAFSCEGADMLAENPELDKACPWLAVAPALRDFKGKTGELCLLHGHPDLAIPRVLAIGLGSREELTPAALRAATGAAMQKCASLGIESVLLPEPFLSRLPGGPERLVEECVCSALLSLYKFTELKTASADNTTSPQWLAIGFNGDTVPDGGQSAARRGELSAWAVCLARDLDNLPGNRLYPEALAMRADRLAGEYGFSCRVMDENALDEAGMGCILSVGRGSVHPPRLVVLEHAPAGHEQEKPIILVGKGITFDSGGICIKPAAKMDQMKCDMSGAAAVLSVICASARENTPRRVIGIMACAENMPDGRAYRPGDVLDCANGETVEVVNTDAEGRLVLCDALAWAQKNWTPAAIIDIATLTGACAIALGSELGGLFCDDDELAGRIMACGKATGNNFWRLPLWKGYEDQLKSNVADIRNTGAREGGAITAALFLRHFIRKGELWAHLDIAGVDWNAKNDALCPEGASGFGVRPLLDLVRGGLS